MENKNTEVVKTALQEKELENVTGGKRGNHSKGKQSGHPKGTTAKLTAVQSIANETRVVYRIGDVCVCCDDCLNMCPSDCIRAGAIRFSIDENACSGCGACVAFCPVGAIEKVVY